MDMEAGKTLTNEEVIRELLELVKKNAMKGQANDVFEICSYVDGLEKKIDSMTEELTNMQNQIKEMQEDTLVNNAKKALSEAQERLNARCEQIKSQLSEVKAQVRSTAKGIVEEAKEKGRAALHRVSEFLGIKKRLLDIRENVRGAIKTTDKDIAKTALLAKEFREAGQTAANAFRTFADKPEVDYSQKEQKHPITKAYASNCWGTGYCSLTKGICYALSARYFRIVGFALSSVPFVVITATMPPALT